MNDLRSFSSKEWKTNFAWYRKVFFRISCSIYKEICPELKREILAKLNERTCSV